MLPWLCLALLVTGSWLVWSKSPLSSHIQPTTAQSAQKAETPYAVKASSNTLFLGNAYWGRYINEWSFRRDLAIIAKTVPVVLRGTGGY